MNIALVILHGDEARGGAERYTVDLAAALARRGNRVSLLARDFGTVPPGVIPVTLPAPGVTRLGQYRGFLSSLAEHLDSQPYEIVHAMLPVPRCDVYHPHAGLAVAALLHGHEKRASAVSAKLSQLANRINLKRRHFAAVERQLLSGQTGWPVPVVLCLSEYVKRSVREHYPLPEAKLATLFNAVDLARFDPRDRPGARRNAIRQQFKIASGDVVALMIAQDFARKGLAQAIAATRLVAAGEGRLRLLVVGRPNPAAYRRQACETGVGDRVIFAGPTDRPADFYQAADLFVLPTRHDPCSLVVLESLAMGVPVISTIQNGACEIMREGAHGFVLPDPADVPALARAMGSMLDDTRRAAMREQCLALRPRLSFDAHVDRLIEIYGRA